MQNEHKLILSEQQVVQNETTKQHTEYCLSFRPLSFIK